jgi:hypothetical protein
MMISLISRNSLLPLKLLDATGAGSPSGDNLPLWIRDDRGLPPDVLRGDTPLRVRLGNGFQRVLCRVQDLCRFDSSIDRLVYPFPCEPCIRDRLTLVESMR